MTEPTGTAEDQAALMERGRLLFARPCEFIAGAAKHSALPEMGLPEIAFAGRSNVGKSSLVNALTGRKTLARTSQTPGRTQQLNFFDLADVLCLVDLPGYGYAKASKTSIANWTDLVNTYLKGRANLVRVFILIDARHGTKDVDRTIMEMLDIAAVTYQAVLTKADKVTGVELEKRLAEVDAELRTHVAAHPVIIATSANTKIGIEQLRAEIATLAEPH
jgi:GTP-binding protein